MAKYKRRPDGRYYTTVSTGELDENGKEIRVPVYGRSVTEFESNIAAIRSAVDENRYTNDKNMPFKIYKEMWCKTYIDNTNLSYNRKFSYRNILKNHTAALDDIPLGKILQSNVQDGYNVLNGHPDLQHEYYITVNQIFKRAIDDRLIWRNPAGNITTTKKPKNKVKNRALSKLERQLLPKVEWTPEQECFLNLLHYAGLRCGEILPLTKSDINFAEGTIEINKAVYFEKEIPKLKDPKTFKGYRTIDIIGPLKSILSDYFCSVDTLLLFPNKNGSMMSKSDYRRFWEAIKIKMNTAAGGKHKWKSGRPQFVLDMCPNFTAKTFRHEYATILYYSGVDLLEAIRLFGHEDSRTLTDIYAELRSEESNSKDKLEKYLNTKYS